MRKSSKRTALLKSLLFQCLVLLTLIAVYNISAYLDRPLEIGAYKRSDYKHWVDEDGNGIDTRNEVLIEESLTPALMSKDGRKVVSGLWVDSYTGSTNTDPKELDIDHLVPLKNAHISGAWKWNPKKKQAYANFLKNSSHLMAVYKSANRQKGDKPPSRWLPPNKAYRCTYLQNWVQVKKEWGLDDDAETLKMWSNCIQSPQPHNH